MRTRRRAIGPALLATALLISLAGVARAGGEGGGDITFRLTLRGDVVNGDAFSLGVSAIDNPTIISPGILCGPGSEAYNPQFVPCRTGSYEFVLEGRDVRPVGTQLEYVRARVRGDEEDRDNTLLYTDTVTVLENDQVFTVVYDYGAARGCLTPPQAHRPSSCCPASPS